jgi:hypothetical protein
LNMGKPLKAKALNRHKRLREQVLSRQGVAEGKRKRLGHSGHFAKVEYIPIVRTPKPKGEDSGGAAGEELGQKRKKSKFNKFRQDLADGEAGEHGDAAHEGQAEQEPAAKKQKESIDARLPGESFTKFMKRIKRETQQLLVTQAAKVTHVAEKRRDFLKQRKKDRKEKQQVRRKGLHKIKEDSEEDEDGLEVSEDKIRAAVQAQPKFGEQVDRPPIIRLKKPPKGLFKQPIADTNSTGGEYIVGGMPAVPEVSGDSLMKRQMEALRKSAISQ